MSIKMKTVYSLGVIKPANITQWSQCIGRIEGGP